MVLVVSVVGVFAQDVAPIPEVPKIPMYIKGDLYVNDKPAKQGVEIQASIESQTKATYFVDTKGKFEFPVPGGSKDSGEDIEFYVDGVLVNETLPWASGEIKENIEFYIEKEGEVNMTFVYGILAVILIIIFVIVLLKLKKRK